MNRFIDNDVCLLHRSLCKCALCGSRLRSPEPRAPVQHKCSLSLWSSVASARAGAEVFLEGTLRGGWFRVNANIKMAKR